MGDDEIQKRRKALARKAFWVTLACYVFVAPIYFAVAPRMNWLGVLAFAVSAIYTLGVLTLAIRRGWLVQRWELEHHEE